MPKKHPIEWTNFSGYKGVTWNPIGGCSPAKGSEQGGCLNCYACRQRYRFDKRLRKGQTPLVVMTSQGPKWTGVVDPIEHKLMEPLRWRKPRAVFVNSMSDLFHEKLPDEAIDRVFAVMALCPQHLFLILTKRAERMREWFKVSRARLTEQFSLNVTKLRGAPIKGARSTVEYWRSLDYDESCKPLPWPLPNVFLGVSCEDQTTADERIPHLLGTPAAVRFVSLEPQLSGVILQGDGEYENPKILRTRSYLRGVTGDQRLDWVIQGGESGPGARPMHPDWARSVRDQCQEAGVPYFFKQWGEWAPKSHGHKGDEGGRWGTLSGKEFFPSTTPWNGHDDDGSGEAIMIRVGKKSAGRLLDGREWSEFPEVMR